MSETPQQQVDRLFAKSVQDFDIAGVGCHGSGTEWVVSAKTLGITLLWFVVDWGTTGGGGFDFTLNGVVLGSSDSDADHAAGVTSWSYNATAVEGRNLLTNYFSGLGSNDVTLSVLVTNASSGESYTPFDSGLGDGLSAAFTA